MKRFWAVAQAREGADGWEVALDGRPLRTPERALLLLPTGALAEAIAEEWRAVEGEVRPNALPLTGLGNAAVDLVAGDRAGFAAGLARYAASDLTCYRADNPAGLVARQAAVWEPVLKGVEARHGLLFQRTAGVMHVPQPEETLTAIERLFAERSPFELAALQPIVSLSGSAVLALAHLDGALTSEEAFAAGALDEDWQAEQWGEDGEAAAVRARRCSEFASAARFLALSR
ncbi:ATPase [Sandaracinobacter sp. RS1-74]|nr:ATPase [Sandaracinobacteroides sayramensis]